MVKPDPKHERACDDFISLGIAEAKRRLGITDFRSKEYLASEVLASLVRARFGHHSGLLLLLGRTLYERITKLTGAYLHKNRQWHGIINASNQTRHEVVSYVWEKLICDPAPVSFAEVRFLTFVEARIQDNMRSRLSQKNQEKSLDAISRLDEDGHKRNYVELIEDEKADTPEVAAIRAQTSAEATKALLTLEPLERHAIHFRLQCDLDWNQTAAALGCSIPTAKKYLERGLEKLRGVEV